MDNYLLKNKFTRINFHLKNEIFSFLPITIKLVHLPYISKKFTFALERNKIISYLKINLFEILDKITEYNISYLESLEIDLINKIQKIEIYEAKDLICYFILKKNLFFEEHYFIGPYSYKYIEFMKFSKNIKILYITGEYDTLYDEDSDTNENKEHFLTLNKFELTYNLKSILNSNKSIHVLYFSYFFIEDSEEDLVCLKEILRNNITINKLCFEACLNIKKKECQEILKEILFENKFINSLSISRMHIRDTPEFMNTLKDILKKNKKIKELKLNSNNIGNSNKGMDIIREILSSNKSIDYLDFTKNNIISSRNKNIFKKMLIESKGIRGLKISMKDCKISQKSYFNNLKEILMKNKKIKKISIDKIDFFHFKYILNNINELSKISSVNQMGLKVKNVFTFFNWKNLKNLLQNSKIKELKIDGCYIDKLSLNILKNCLVKNKNIKKLIIKKLDNLYDCRVFEIIKNIIMFNKNLESFTLTISNTEENKEYYIEQLEKLNKKINMRFKFNLYLLKKFYKFIKSFLVFLNQEY